MRTSILIVLMMLCGWAVAQPNGPQIETNEVAFLFEGDCDQPNQGCDNNPCNTCVRMFQAGTENFRTQYFRFGYGGFIELDQNGQEDPVRRITTLPEDFGIDAGIPADCNGCTAARTFTATVPNAFGGPISLRISNWLYDDANSVTDVSGNTVSVLANSLKYTIEVTNWPFAVNSTGLRIILTGQVAGLSQSAFNCFYNDTTSDNCDNPRAGFTSFNVTTGGPSGQLDLAQTVSLRDTEGGVYVSMPAIVRGPEQIGNSPANRRIDIDVPRFGNQMIYDPNAGFNGISGGSKYVPFAMMIVALMAMFVW